MARWTPFTVVGGSYADDTKPWSVQDTVNYIPVPAEKEGVRSRAILRCAPGLVPMTLLGTGAPIRGMRNVEGALFVVSGQSLFKIGNDGAATELGTIPGVTRCSMSHNQIAGGNEVVISNGQGGYVYNTAANTLAQITDSGFPGAISFDFVDGYILGIEPARRFAFTSDLAAATSYSTLDEYQAEGSPDLLVGQAVTHREWWLMGDRTIEPFVNTGAAEGTFQRAAGTVMEVGLAATHAVAVMDNSVFWLGSDGIVYRANGYTPQRISTHAIEQAIGRCNTAQAFAFTFEDRGHKVFYLTFPDGHTWGYDAATGEWHRRQSYGLDRWRINCLVKWRGTWIAGDYSNGVLYQLDWDTQDENGQPLGRRRITGVTHDNQNALVINALELVVDTGLPPGNGGSLVVPRLSLSGALPDATQGDTVSYTYTRKGGVLPVSIALHSGALPTGLSVNSSGKVTGTATAHGTFSWVLRATDALGNTYDLADSAVISSTDIIHFTTYDDGLAQSVLSCHAANGVLFMGCANSTAAYTTNAGASWTLLSGLPALPYTVTEFNGDWYVLGHISAGRAIGSSFSFSTMSNPPPAQQRSATVMRGSLFVGDYTSNTSTINTKVWKMVSPGAAWTGYDLGVKYGPVRCMLDTGTAYLFGTTAGKIMRSTDLSTFSLKKDAGAVNITNLCKLGSKILASTSDGGWYTSTDDGVTWSTKNTTPLISNACVTPSMFIGGFNTTINTSPDGATWTQRYTDVSIDFFSDCSADSTQAVFPKQNRNITVGTA